MCEPGQKTCMGDSSMTCDPTGQMLVPTPCGSNMKCTGAGQCVQCTEASDCSELTKDCKVGACVQSKCVAQDASSSKACTASNGKPGKCASGGTCQCTPQCNKPCGDNGCGGQCPNTCGSLMCANDACVECTADSQCRASADGCKAGVCTGGSCSQSASAREGASCRAGSAAGTCRSGTCECTSDCGRGRCERDSCGRSCNVDCGSGESCQNNVCRAIPRPPAPSRCTSAASCVVGVETCDSTLGYCTEYCTGDATICLKTGRECVASTACAVLPPCPVGMTTTSYSGVTVCAWAARP